MNRHVTLQIQGAPVHICYEVLPNNLCLWDLNRYAYELEGKLSIEANKLFSLLENMLRQHYAELIQRDLLEHSFYEDMHDVVDYSEGSEDIPF